MMQQALIVEMRCLGGMVVMGTGSMLSHFCSTGGTTVVPLRNRFT